MKLNAIKFFGFLLAALLLSSYMYRENFLPGQADEVVLDAPVSEDSDKNQLLMQVLMASIGQQHFQPLALNDDFSDRVFDLYLKRLDYSKRFLLAEDVKKLESHRKKLDDAIQVNDYTFFDLSRNLVEKRIGEAQKIYEKVLSKPFDFTVKEDINLDPENMAFAEDKKALEDRWRKSLKYQTLDRLTGMIERQEEAEKEGEEGDAKSEKEEKKEKKTFEQMEEEARSKVKKNLDNWFKRLEKLDQEDRLSTYLNAIMNAYGPHTNYFPPKDKENFDISMSGQLEGIGARLQEKDGYIKVSDIVPGSASYKQGGLKAGDLILMVAQGDEEPVDIVDMSLDDAVKLIRGKKGTEVRLTVKKVDGSNKVIPIIRDIVEIEETYAKSSLLRNDRDEKVGYIKLPKFYADFSRWNGRSCAKDVKTEIEKLKAQNVEGIILDLRNNGGGSLRDAVDMAGLFIEKGPVVQVKYRGRQAEVLSDKDPRIQYDGALVVLVNQFSASASEILAAAVQDYDRGVIIGSSSSFGKGTVQRFFSLDKALPSDYDEFKPLGEVKITTQKFYRINGGATQLRGVTPDIVLPDSYAYIETGEKEQEFVMPWDEIRAVPYEKWNHSWDLEVLRTRSAERVAKDETFGLVEENARRLKSQSDNDIYSLNLEAYQAYNDQLDEEAKKYKGLNTLIDAMQAEGLATDLSTMESDTTKTRIHTDWVEGIRKDHYINEALHVIADMNANSAN